METYYNAKEKVAANKDGFITVKKKYNAADLVSHESYLNASKKPEAVNGKGYAAVDFTYDDNKNLTGQTYFDAKDKKTYCKDGYAAIAFTYNEENKKTSEKYYDTKGNLATVPSKGCAMIRHAYNEKKKETPSPGCWGMQRRSLL